MARPSQPRPVDRERQRRSDYLAARGFSPATIAKVGWRIEALDGNTRLYGLPPEAAGVTVWVIPYDGFERIRLIDAADLEQFGGGKYRQPARQPLALYDPFDYLRHEAPFDALLLVEGEANAVAVHEALPALRAVGLPGMRALTPELATRIGPVPLVDVWLDRDEAGYADAARAVRDRLLAAGVDEVRFLDSGGVDANEALIEFGSERLGELVQQLLAQATPIVERDEGPRLLDGLTEFVRRYVVMKPTEARVVALWVVHTHAIDAAEATPYLAITSPEKQCGKSRLFEVLELLVARPLTTANISDAALFRSIGDGGRTLLFDEIDAVFGPKARDREDLRGMLNAGHRRGAEVVRCVGDGSKQRVETFPVFCPKALAGIGRLPDTIADRSITVRLERRMPDQHIDRFRRRDVEPLARDLRDRAEHFASETVDLLGEARPDLPAALDDRAQDAAEPLLAIADLAHGDWPALAREALLDVYGDRQADDDSIGVRLLADIYAVFEQSNEGRISSADLLEELNALDEAPWAEWRGKPLTTQALARLLKPYKIRTRDVRLEHGDGRKAKGFKREQFEAAWSRYLPRAPRHRDNPHPERENGHSEPATTTLLSRPENGRNPTPEATCRGVADAARNGGGGQLGLGTTS